MKINYYRDNILYVLKAAAVVFVLISDERGHLLISSHIKAYSKLERPVPYFIPGSDSLGINKFHKPAALAFP